jgi:protein-arginine kinase activator protein McsA
MKCSKCGEEGAWLISQPNPEGKKIVIAICGECYNKQLDPNSGQIESVKKFIDKEIEDIKKQYEAKGEILSPSLEELMSGVAKDIQEAMESLMITPDQARDLMIEDSCPRCGLFWEDIQKTGKLGCEGCYDTFPEKIESIIKKIQGGATHHIGKMPSKKQAQEEQKIKENKISNAHLIETLEKRLQEAVEAEDYENAALFRDKIKALKG